MNLRDCSRGMPSDVAHASRVGFTIVELLVVIAIIGVLIGLLLPAVQSARESSRRSTCINNLKQWALSMHLHHDGKRSLPYGGSRHRYDRVESLGTAADTARTPFAVWLWPYLEQTPLYEAYDQDAGFHVVGTNRTLVGKPYKHYYCPSDRPNAKIGDICRMNYVVNWGTTTARPSTADDARRAPFGWTSPSASAANYVSYRTRFVEVTDGLSKTLLLSEVRFPPDDSGTDIRGHALNDQGAPWFMTHAGPNSSTADASAAGYCINFPDLPCSTNNWVTSRQATRSRHPGGVNVVMCDGSARFIPDGIALLPWQRLSMMNDNEVIGNYE